MEAHGGFICRLHAFEGETLVSLARQALESDGQDPTDCALAISVLPDRRVMRLAFDGAYTYGRAGALWYKEHHTFARQLSRVAAVTVHAYVLDPDGFEMVSSYRDGRKVGGERLDYEDAEVPDSDGHELDDRGFERLKRKWPLGHLAKLLGLTREELVRLPRAETVLLELDGRDHSRLPDWAEVLGLPRRTNSGEHSVGA